MDLEGQGYDTTEGLLDAERAAPLVRSELSNLDPSTVPYRLHVRGARDLGIPFKPIFLSAISNTHKFEQYCSNRRLHLVSQGSVKDSADIPLIDCDKNSTLLNANINDLQTYNVSCVIFYSSSEAGCALTDNSDWFKKEIPNSFTSITNGDTLQLLSRVTGQDTIATITKKSVIGGIEIFAIVIVVLAILFAALVAVYRCSRKRPRLTNSALDKLPLVKVCTHTDFPLELGSGNKAEERAGEAALQNERAADPLAFPQPPPSALVPPITRSNAEHQFNNPWHENVALHAPERTPWRLSKKRLARDAYPFPLVLPERGAEDTKFGAGPEPPEVQAPLLAAATPATAARGAALEAMVAERQPATHGWREELQSEPQPEHDPEPEPSRHHHHHWNIRKSLVSVGALLSPGVLLSPGSLLAKRHVGQYVNEHDEICAICLETFGIGELLRKLPCNHYFHSSCVDRWLLKSSTVCPLCRSNVLQQATNSSRAAAAVAAATPRRAGRQYSHSYNSGHNFSHRQV